MTTTYESALEQGRSKIDCTARAERQAALAAARSKQTAKARRDAAAMRLTNWTTLRSLSRAFDVGIGAAVLACSSVMFAAMWPAVVLTVAGMLATTAAGCAAWVMWRRRTLLRMNRSLPFDVTHFGQGLDWPRSYPSCKLTVRFASTPPASSELVALFASLRTRWHCQSVKVEKRAGHVVELEVDSDVGSKFDGHRRWLARWWPHSVRHAWLPLHAAHPLLEVSFPG